MRTIRIWATWLGSSQSTGKQSDSRLSISRLDLKNHLCQPVLRTRESASRSWHPEVGFGRNCKPKHFVFSAPIPVARIGR